MPPSRLARRSIALLVWPHFDTSAAAVTWGPSGLSGSSPESSSSPSFPRAISPRRAPRPASSTLSAFPIPLDAPVTMALVPRWIRTP